MKKRLVSMLLALVMVLGMLPATALAASSEEEALGEVNIYNGEQKLSYLSINGRIRELIYTYFNYVDSNGRTKEIPAYCVNPNTKGVPQTVGPGESIKYIAKEKGSDPKVMGIIANGYPTRGLSELKLENKYHAYYATKMALWCYLLPNWNINNLKVNPNLTGKELQRAQAILAAAKDIYVRGTAWNKVYSPRVTATPDRDTAYAVTVDGQQYKQQVFTIHSDTWVCNYAIRVAFSDPASVPAGARIVDMDNKDITTITTSGTGDGYGGKFKVLYPAAAVAGKTGSVQLSFTTDVYKYAVFYAVCAEQNKYGQLQNYMCDTDPTVTILFSNESRETGVVPLSAAVAQINYDFNAELEALQTADNYDSISVTGQPADWVEVLAVFAVKVAGSDEVDAADVATMDAARIARLKAVFWDMTTITHRIEVIHHPGSGEDDDGWTERNLYITISAKTAEEMKTAYRFNRNQIAALEELLEQRDLLLELIDDVYSVSGDTAALIRNLPEDLSPEREALVRTACSLVGKVNYFWGGKSLTIGWDARWGELRQVTAAGSSTTGTYRPYGVDCSGFVDWVFYNATNGSYIIGHGGGAMSQHGYCTPISWDDALPGDLVFYPDDSHVGIVGGRDANGDLLIIHCASGHNNVVITGLAGFTAIGRPMYYTE